MQIFHVTTCLVVLGRLTEIYLVFSWNIERCVVSKGFEQYCCLPLHFLFFSLINFSFVIHREKNPTQSILPAYVRYSNIHPCQGFPVKHPNLVSFTNIFIHSQYNHHGFAKICFSTM